MSVVGIARSAGSQIRSTGVHLRTTSSHLTVISAPRRRKPWTEGFYESPLSAAQLAKLAPGALIRIESMDAYLMPGVRLRARVQRMLYRSTGAVGEPTAVSGVLMLPDRPRRHGPTPLVGFAIGTHGIGDHAAPSRLLSTGRDWEASLMAHVLARGFAVAITDYQGLGTPGDHAFMVGRVLGANVLDAMRAACNLAPDELAIEAPAGVMGYSEGGAAAAWAAQLQPVYAPEITLAGVAAGAAAADMELAGPGLDGSFFSFFLAYGAIGYAAAYPELELDPYLTTKALAQITMLRESNIFQAAVHGPRFARADRLTEPNVMELPEWRARLAENRLGASAPAAPVLLHHARHDQIVSYAHSRQLQQEWQALGAQVTLRITRGGLDHLTGAVVGTPIALEWLTQQLRKHAASAPADNVVPLKPAARRAS
ncbi:MAG TPA: lipase family protein [Solirubrobacteraceae bacterium]|nr:lipase family protein [Solirubrobacteraceae bacterium]